VRVALRARHLLQVDIANAGRQEDNAMLHYAIVFFVIALIAAVFGFTGIAAGAAEIAKILFYIFLVVFVVTLLLGVLHT